LAPKLIATGARHQEFAAVDWVHWTGEMIGSGRWPPIVDSRLQILLAAGTSLLPISVAVGMDTDEQPACLAPVEVRGDGEWRPRLPRG
jgi:hypothetical protein